MIYVSITMEITLGAAKTYLGQLENAHSIEEVLERITNSNTDFIELQKPANLARTQQGIIVSADPLESVWIRTDCIKTIGKIQSMLQTQYSKAVSDITVSDTGEKQEILQ